MWSMPDLPGWRMGFMEVTSVRKLPIRNLCATSCAISENAPIKSNPGKICREGNEREQYSKDRP